MGNCLDGILSSTISRTTWQRIERVSLAAINIFKVKVYGAQDGGWDQLVEADGLAGAGLHKKLLAQLPTLTVSSVAL